MAALWGFLRPPVTRPIGFAALAAPLGWGGWLLYDLAADQAGFSRLGGRLADTMHLPLVGLLAVTLLLPALLAWSAAAIGCRLASFLSRSAPPSSPAAR